MGQLKRLVIHCTATPEGREVTAEKIRRWHMDPPPAGRGWSRVGYSDLIHLDGHIERLQDYDEDHVVDNWEITNGAAGYNSTSRHVVYAGGTRHGQPFDTRTPAQMLALKFYVERFRLFHPDAEIIGHNWLNKSKACPSFNVETWLGAIGLQNRR